MLLRKCRLLIFWFIVNLINFFLCNFIMVMCVGEGIVFSMLGMVVFGFRVIFLVFNFYIFGLVLSIVFMLFRKFGILVFVFILVFVNMI